MSKRSEILKHFTYSQLPEPSRAVAEELNAFADRVDAALPPSAEKSAGLRKLLEARDCFVRASEDFRRSCEQGQER